MGRLDDLAKGLDTLAREYGHVLRDTMKADPLTEADILARQKEQLYAGLASSGKHLQPTMDRDPYFRGNNRAWYNYAVIKKRRFAGVPGNERRPINVPNLNLSSGLFHSGFYVDYRMDDMQVDNNQFIRGVDVYAKYGAEQFGLTDDNWDGVLAHVVPLMIESIKKRMLL